MRFKVEKAGLKPLNVAEKKACIYCAIDSVNNGTYTQQGKYWLTIVPISKAHLKKKAFIGRLLRD